MTRDHHRLNKLKRARQEQTRDALYRLTLARMRKPKPANPHKLDWQLIRQKPAY
jgi:hypothetical protein